MCVVRGLGLLPVPVQAGSQPGSGPLAKWLGWEGFVKTLLKALPSVPLHLLRQICFVVIAQLPFPLLEFSFCHLHGVEFKLGKCVMECVAAALEEILSVGTFYLCFCYGVIGWFVE